MTAVSVGVLGPLEVHGADGVAIELGAPKPRMLLAALALSPGRAVSVDALLDLIWGDSPTPGAMSTLHAYVSVLRKALEPDRTRRTTAQVLVTQSPGYALKVGPEDVDAGVFATTVNAWHRRLAGPLLGPAEADTATLTEGVAALDAALALWRGEPYAELGDLPGAVAERGHLEELRLVALEDRAWARLALGDHATVAAELEPLTAAHPLRERLWALRALALVRSGRQGDALDVLRSVREVLADELGLDPGVELQDLQDRILKQDTALGWERPAAAPARTPSSPAEPVAPEPEAPAHEWPLLGRDHEVDLLRTCLGRAVRGHTELVVVTGEPGIGKSRLCDEVLEQARARGARTVVGRCSQDDGAPPLYPWRGILADLGGALTEEVREGSEFRTWEEITTRVREAATERPLVLLLDDLHWADTATLRALRLLVETSTDDALLVVLTWRDRPEPSGALADLADALARRHAERLHLSGLDATSVAGLVVALTAQRPSEQDSRALAERTDGNPFFLVEYARLVGRGDALDEVLRHEPPTVVQDVVTRRLTRLPEQTLRTLGVAAVLGRQFDLATLARTAGEDEDDVLDLLDPALAVGLVREDGVDRFTFDHALVRDTLVARLPVSRRARLHARAAAAIADGPGHETELARHWLASGPVHAAQAWRAAERAAQVSLAAYAHDEAADLLHRALDSLDADPDASDHDRWRLLTALAVAHRWGGRWADLTAAAGQAIEVATRLDDAAALAEAATLTLRGAHWQSARHGGQHAEIVEALRRSLATLPAGDSPLRARCLVALAGELYYVSGPDERRALCDDAVQMARRLDDPEVLLDTYLGAAMALWFPGTEAERLQLVEAALECARDLGDLTAEVSARTQLAHIRAALGRPDLMWQEYDVARPAAERLRMDYAVLVLDSMAVAWLVMAERDEEADAALAACREALAKVRLDQAEDALAGLVSVLCMWRGEPLVPELLTAAAEGPLPVNAMLAWLILRAGDEEGALEFLHEHPAELDHLDWFSLLAWALAAGMAAYDGDADLGARSYALLAPHAGHPAVAGSGVASGPVDAYLALAAHAAGEQETASRHADDAERLGREWALPRFERWLVEVRARFGF